MGSVSDYLRAHNRTALALTSVIFPALLAISLQFVSRTPVSWVNWALGAIALIALAAHVVVALIAFKWTPSVAAHADLADAREALVKYKASVDTSQQLLQRDVDAYGESSTAFAVMLATLRLAHLPDPNVPWLEAAKAPPREAFRELAAPVLRAMVDSRVLGLLGGRTAPRCCSLSLYYPAAVQGVLSYELLSRAPTPDFEQMRSRSNEPPRSWPANRAALSQAVGSKHLLVRPNLQEPGLRGTVPNDSHRDYDANLYRGAMLLRSNWAIGPDSEFSPDFDAAANPAFILIWTSSEIDAFAAADGNESAELIVESLRDYLDTLLFVTHNTLCVQRPLQES